jgi:ornithine carbamoyltransferase
MKRDFLQLSDRTSGEYRVLFDRAKVLKLRRAERRVDATLVGRCIALVFEKPSTRTRLSFEAAMAQLGGSAIVLPLSDSQISRGEPLADTARVVSRYCDAIVMRTFAAQRLVDFARAATVPILNGLTDAAHPLQVLADLFTVEERLGRIAGKRFAFVGDGSSNMARSFIEAAALFDFELRLATPAAYLPPDSERAAAGQRLSLTHEPTRAVEGADVIITDVWTSMGQESESEQRRRAFEGYCVDSPLVAKASPSAIVLHCLPAHRGEEISEAVLEGPQSAVWDEAENRLHVQKALLEQILLATPVAFSNPGATRS